MQSNLNREQALELLKQYNKEAFHLQHALTVEGVKNATVELRADPERTLGGDIRLTLTDGGSATVAL